MHDDTDPLQRSVDRLSEALTVNRARAQSRSGLLWVDACADGELTIHIDDHALPLSGEELGRQLTALAAQALAEARAQAHSALKAFRADPRIDAVVAETAFAIDRPRPER
ncbi:hypothetical protein VMT65_16430 [Nocardia sp. CDC153]|uniref:hypothetical protein n=1 Tax=Nocardia sp. CDC153 TaxID=3112167 RepID=UPI002DBD7C17|nr:hypothetical protein [Nocardia sp. CDC153]MEC3954628.1 hypothetical protein [Nocardia sp. CDC153]